MGKFEQFFYFLYILFRTYKFTISIQIDLNIQPSEQMRFLIVTKCNVHFHFICRLYTA